MMQVFSRADRKMRRAVHSKQSGENERTAPLGNERRTEPRMPRNAPRGVFLRTAAVLAVIGLVPALLIRSRIRTAPLTFAADLLFTESSVFFLWGLIRLLGNLRAFTSFTWSVKTLRTLLKNGSTKHTSAQDYLAYRESRPVHDDVKALLLTAGALLAVSVVLTILA